MKSQSAFNLFSLFFTVLLTFSLNAQNDVTTDSTGFPGDGFSLEGALELLKESKSLEDFEKKLNAEDNYVNNLDLNEDGEVDYVRVIDNMDGKVHAITLQVPLNEKESQDVAVIGVQEEGKENAVLQIIGDADVYGEETLVEPFEEAAKSNGKGGPSVDARITRVVVNVYFWPCIRFIYRPSYVVYVSPWRWHYYPNYWRPWRPRPWHVCHTHRVTYHRHYHVTHTHRVNHAHRVYTPHRRTSTTVSTRTTTVKAVRGPAGKTAVKKTTTTKTTAAKPSTKQQKSAATNKASTANTKASTANKKTSAANAKASTANKKTSTASTKASTTQQKATTANKKASTVNKGTQQKTSKQKNAKQKSSQQRSTKQKSRSGGHKSKAGGKGKRN